MLRAGVRAATLVVPALMEFETFYRSELPSMVGLARTICGDHETAKDIAQEAMSKAYENWPKIASYDKPGAWLRRVTINLAISKRRRAGRELSLLRRSAAQQRATDRHEDIRPDDEVWDAVRKLPPRQRAVVALFYQDDLSTTAIAEILDCSVSTATSHLSQARATLAVALGESFADRAEVRS